MDQTRRSIISAIGLALPFGFDIRGGQARPSSLPPVIRLVPFEEAVRKAFQSDAAPEATAADPFPCRRIEVGWSEEVQAGLQGCHNDRPFAGFPAGHLRIVRSGSRPGGLFRGVRLHVWTVEVALTGRRPYGDPTRPLDFSSLPPAPTLS